MVEIFKTNIDGQQQAEVLLKLLSKTFPEFKINFDLEDCDKVLRIEGSDIVPEKIIDLLEANAHCCELLN
jgi:hypothetical protein